LTNQTTRSTHTGPLPVAPPAATSSVSAWPQGGLKASVPLVVPARLDGVVVWAHGVAERLWTVAPPLATPYWIVPICQPAVGFSVRWYPQDSSACPSRTSATHGSGSGQRQSSFWPGVAVCPLGAFPIWIGEIVAVPSVKVAFALQS
jgi:hypothetical protein